MLRRLPIRLLMIVMAALLGAALPHASAQDSAHREHKRAERAQIVALEKEWQKAALADDFPAMDKLLSDDYLGITATGEVLTKTQQLARMRDRKFMLTKLEISDTQYQACRQHRHVTCLAQLQGTSEDEALHGAYRYTRVYQRLSGNVWKSPTSKSPRQADRNTPPATRASCLAASLKVNFGTKNPGQKARVQVNFLRLPKQTQNLCDFHARDRLYRRSGTFDIRVQHVQTQ